MLDGVESHTQSQSQYQWCREPSQSKGRFSQASHQTPGNGELPLHGSRHISRQELVHYGTFPQRSIGFTLHSWVLLLVTLSVCLVVLGELSCSSVPYWAPNATVGSAHCLPAYKGYLRLYLWVAWKAVQ